MKYFYYSVFAIFLLIYVFNIFGARHTLQHHYYQSVNGQEFQLGSRRFFVKTDLTSVWKPGKDEIGLNILSIPDKSTIIMAQQKRELSDLIRERFLLAQRRKYKSCVLHEYSVDGRNITGFNYLVRDTDMNIDYRLLSEPNDQQLKDVCEAAVYNRWQ